MDNQPIIDATSSNKANIQSDAIGAKTISVYMERKVKTFGISETELTFISYFNTTSTATISIGAFFLSIFIDNVKNPLYPDYIWALDPVGWASLVFFAIGTIAFFFKGSLVRKIKAESFERS